MLPAGQHLNHAAAAATKDRARPYSTRSSHGKSNSIDVQGICVTGKVESDGMTGCVRGCEGCEKADKDGGIVGHRHREN
jgi:hypothetical protein